MTVKGAFPCRRGWYGSFLATLRADRGLRPKMTYSIRGNAMIQIESTVYVRSRN